jgi:hypothetical protein
MKLMMRNWKWMAGLLAVGLICATGLLAKIQTASANVDTQATVAATVNLAPPDAQEAADAASLIQAVNVGDAQTALEILHAYGLADDTLQAMAARWGQSPAHVELNESFLKASVGALALLDPSNKTNVQACLQAVPMLGYDRPVCIPRQLDITSIANFDADISQCPLAPIAVLNVKLNDSCFIRYFQWYDRYAESLHSVVLNGADLSNAKLDVTNYAQANLTLNALFQLIKVRKPDAFVWLGVVKRDDRSDEPWLKALTFQPDGLQISNLRQFHSPFADTYQRYVGIIGTNTPMMVAGFYGYTAALQEKGDLLLAALTNNNSQALQTSIVQAAAQLGNVGAAVGQDLAQEETNLQAMGYRGISSHWLLLTAMANSGQAVAVDKSDLIDPRADLLETYHIQKDYANFSALTAEMISNSAPGDMNWTVGKLYNGMILLSQTPLQTNAASAVLDEVLAFDFKNRPGRDHYIIGAAEWRIYAASLGGDTNKMQALAQWVQNGDFRQDLKSAFLKKYRGLLAQPTTSTN